MLIQKQTDRNLSRIKLILSSRKPRLLWKLSKIKIGLMLGAVPPFRHIEVVNTFDCNLNCEHCSAKTLRSNKPRLTLKDYQRVGEECKQHNLPVVSFTGGEPLCDPRLEEIIKCFNPNETLIGITTNGTFVNKEKLKRLKKLGLNILLVSLDSPQSVIHDSFRNMKGASKKAMETIKVACKLGIETIIITTVHHQNIRRKDGLLGMIDLAKKLGVLLHVSLAAPVGKWANEKNCRKFLLTKADQKYLRQLRTRYPFIRRDFDSNYTLRGCPAGTERFVILPDGEVLTCTKIHASFGNVRQDSMLAIRERMMKYKIFRETLPRCLCAESAEFISKYMKNCFGKKKVPLKERDFFKGEKIGSDGSSLSAVCPVCGSKEIDPYRDDVIDFEYQVEGYFPLVKCRSCGLVRQKLIPGYSELNRFYPQDYLVYGETSRSRLGFFLALLKKQLYRQRAKKYVRLIGKSGRILDVGCANCSLLMSLKPLGAYKLYGVDIKDLGINYQSLEVKFQEGPLEKINFPRNFFDLVILDNLIEHVPNPKFFLKKVYRILKPGGWVVGTTPNIHSIDALLFGRYWGGYHLPRHFYFFTSKTLRRLLQKVGFSNIDFPVNANPGDWCVSIQNFLRRNEGRMKKYKRGWYFPLMGCLFTLPSFLFSFAGWHSIMDFKAQRKKERKYEQ